MVIKINNTISNASNSRVSSFGQRAATFSSEINSGSDVDLYMFPIKAEDKISIDIDAHEFGSSLDSVLRIFDAYGNEQAVSDDTSAPGESHSLDSYLEFIPSKSGNYYFGISSFANFNYNPLDDGDDDLNHQSGSSTGSYKLLLDISQVVSDEDRDDTISDETIEESSPSNGLGGNDTINGTSAADKISGGAGYDSLTGDGGDDTLNGGEDNDVIHGNKGDDLLYGGSGADIFYGGAGSDTFGIVWDEDTIYDFESGSDKLWLGNRATYDELSIKEARFPGGTTIWPLP